MTTLDQRIRAIFDNTIRAIGEALGSATSAEIAALAGHPQTIAPPAARRATVPPAQTSLLPDEPPSRRTRRTIPREEVNQKVLEAILNAPSPISSGELSKATGFDAATILPSLRVHRTEGRIAMSGKKRTARYTGANVKHAVTDPASVLATDKGEGAPPRTAKKVSKKSAGPPVTNRYAKR